MKQAFQKMMREQIQVDLADFDALSKKPKPTGGWINLIRRALGMSSYQLAKRMNCSQANALAFERREKKGNISLEALDTVAQALNCRLVYYFVPNQPLDKILENQARLLAQKHLRSIGHSMELEQQGLTPRQKKQQEDDLVLELLQGNLRHLWEANSEI